MTRADLGDTEHLVLLAILRLGTDAYGIPILDEVSARSGRAKRFFKLKPSGLKALRESREMFLNLWRDYETVLDRA